MALIYWLPLQTGNGLLKSASDQTWSWDFFSLFPHSTIRLDPTSLRISWVVYLKNLAEFFVSTTHLNALLRTEWRRSTFGWKHTIIFHLSKPFQDNVSTTLIACMKFTIHSLPTTSQENSLFGFLVAQNKPFFSYTLFLGIQPVVFRILLSYSDCSYNYCVGFIILYSMTKKKHLLITTQHINWCLLMASSIFI